MSNLINTNFLPYNQSRTIKKTLNRDLLYIKSYNYLLYTLTISAICVLAGSKVSMSAPVCADNSMSGNHSVYASGNITCYAEHDYYSGLNTAHASGEGAKLIFLKDNVIIDGGGPGGAAHTLIVGGATSNQIPGASAIIANGNIIANSHASINGRAVYVHHNTLGSEANSLSVAGNLIIDHIGDSGAGIENNGGLIDIYGNTTITTLDADAIRSREFSLSNYYQSIDINSFGTNRSGIRSNGGIINALDSLNMSFQHSSTGISSDAGGVVNIFGPADIYFKGGGQGINANSGSVVTFESDASIRINPSSGQIGESIGVKTKGGTVDFKKNISINTVNANAAAIDADDGRVSVGGDLIINNMNDPQRYGVSHGINIKGGSEVILSGSSDIYVNSGGSSIIRMTESDDNINKAGGNLSALHNIVYINKGILNSENGDISTIKGGIYKHYP